MNGDATEEEKVSIKQEVDEKPDIKDTFPEESDDEYRLFMGNNNWYLFLRLHQILCSRLTTMYNHAVRIAAQEAKDRKDRKESTAVALRLKPKNEIAVEDYYPALLDMVKNVLDGNMESTVYEDTLREMFGIHAYTAFTLDKVVNGAVRQLQHLVCDEPCHQCTQLYLQESRKGGSGGPLASAHRRLAMEQAYQKKAEQVLQDENCFKIYTYQRDCRMTIELVDTEVEGDDDNGGGGGNSAPSSNIPSNVAEVERWSEYVERYVSCVSPEMSPAMMSQLSRKPVFLPRNLRSWRKLTAARQRLTQQGQGDREKSSNGDGEDSKTSLVSDMEMLDNTQCKFNLASFKMVFVVNSDSYMYKKKALQRAKQSHKCVSDRMRRGMREWQKLWCSQHVSDANHRATKEWLMGRAESQLPNRTEKEQVDIPSQAPYAPYNKYKCKMLDEGS